MDNSFALVLPLLEGIVLGIAFFAGLWYTVRKGLGSKKPAFWFLASFALRMAIVLIGFYFIAAGGWLCLLSGTAGFIIGRLLVVYITRMLSKKKVTLTKEIQHGT